MFRRKKNDKAPEASGSTGDAAPTTVLEDADAPVGPAETAASEPAAEVPPEPGAAEPGGGEPGAGEPGGGEVDGGPGYELPPRVWVESVLDTRPPPSREQLESQAAADFQAAIAPSLAPLQQAVPDASSAEEARRILEEREQQTELLPDPEGDRARGKDIFRTEASVHYRIQRHLERPRRRVGWGEPWRPPAGLARPASSSSRRSLGRGRE